MPMQLFVTIPEINIFKMGALTGMHFMPQYRAHFENVDFGDPPLLPTDRPNNRPTDRPAGCPNNWPADSPTVQPTGPTVQPSDQPAVRPTNGPTA